MNVDMNNGNELEGRGEGEASREPRERRPSCAEGEGVEIAAQGAEAAADDEEVAGDEEDPTREPPREQAGCTDV